MPEFRDLVIHPAQMPAPPAARLSGVLAKASGVAPSPTERKRPADPDTIDVGASPSGTVGASGNRRQPPSPSPPRSGRLTPVDGKPEPDATGPSNHTPSPPDLVTLTVERPADPQAETEPFAEAIDSKTEFVPPDPALAQRNEPTPPPLPSTPATPPPPQPPTNWTPTLLGLVIVLSLMVVYLLIKR